MTKFRSIHVPTPARGVQRQVLPALLLASSSVLLLSGCSTGLNFAGHDATGSANLSELHGTVHGGQAPVTGAQVALYEIGATATSAAGYAAALGTPLGTTTTDAGGNWSIPSPTACTNQNDELYLVASEGMEVGNTTNNTALVLTSVGGPCGSQFTNSFNIDEVTTVATEYALSGFSTDYKHVGTSASNGIGLTNAFATVTNLVNLSNGSANTTTPAYATSPSNSTADVFSSIVPNDTINTLANVLATCVNAAGGASDSACTTLLSYAGGSNSWPVGQNGVQGPVASNTADAALYIAHNPGLPAASGFTSSNIAAVWGIPTPQAPFGPTLTAAPNDYTLTLNFVSGGLGGNALSNVAGGSQMTIDNQGGVWVVDSREKVVTSLSNLGAPLSPTTQVNGTTTISKGGYALPFSTSGRLDTDQNGNVWISDSASCVFALSPSGSQLSGSPFTSACPAGGQAVTVDGSNNVWVGGTSAITSISNPSGTVRAGFPITSGFDVLTEFLGPDEAGNVWWTDEGSNSAGFITSTGSLSTEYTGTLSGPGSYSAFGVAAHGLALWIPEPTNDDIHPEEAVSPFGVGVYNTFLPPGGFGEAEIQTDGFNRFWWDDQGSSVASVPPNISTYLVNETQVSPGFGYQGGTPNVTLDVPDAMVIDQSGNAWVVNFNNYNAVHKTGPYGSQYVGSGSNATNVTEFVGLAAPSQPVNSFNAKNSTYGVEP